MPRKVRWGIAGLGNIANKFAADLIITSTVDLIAVASSNLSRAEAFKDNYGAKKAYGSYNELYKDTDIEVIYIAGLNSDHKQMTIDALNAGKAVLCEKPLGLNTTEVNQMIDVAKAQKCFLMEGLWSRFNPAINRAKEWIEKGKIGVPRFLYAEFSFYRLDADRSHRLMAPEKGGGALLDIGIYPLFLAYFLFGMPKDMKALTLNASTGVDIQTSIILQYENAQAMLYCGITNNSDNNAKIGGTEGEIVLPGRWHDTQSIDLIKKQEKIRDELPTLGNGFTYQIDEVNYCILNNKTEGRWGLKNTSELASLLAQVVDMTSRQN